MIVDRVEFAIVHVENNCLFWDGETWIKPKEGSYFTASSVDDLREELIRMSSLDIQGAAIALLVKDSRYQQCILLETLTVNDGDPVRF